jgi:phospholipase C
MSKTRTRLWNVATRGVLALTLAASAAAVPASIHAKGDDDDDRSIRHVVVIFQENVSFDHYFATYPRAMNPRGEPQFHAIDDTPSVNGLNHFLLTHNPNKTNPFRLDRSQAATCDQDHDYTPEQRAFDHGLMDKFVENTGSNCHPEQTMGYFDGNTVTALWNYAQHFAMSDNSFNTTFGPSTPGALNLVSGQTHGVVNHTGVLGEDVDSAGTTVIGDPQPFYDDCSTRETVAMSGTNVGDLLSKKDGGITWGWFQGGFRPTTPWNPTTKTKAVCGASHTGSDGNPKGDYIPHHEPFQYYASTSNPHHLRPSSVGAIGHDSDQANHQYDLIDFWAAVDAGQIPAVSYLKAPGYLDGHAGYSDPLAEQRFLVETINRLQRRPEWRHMAIVIAWDDSDGWYDHAMGPIVSQSNDATFDALTDAGHCGTSPAGAYPGRCGYGPRLPLLVISPFAQRNFVDHGVTDQSSILRFIEDNWRLGRIGDDSFDEKAGSLWRMFDFDDHFGDRRLFLDPASGEP